jgi:hypothetical protein
VQVRVHPSDRLRMLVQQLPVLLVQSSQLGLCGLLLLQDS